MIPVTKLLHSIYTSATKTKPWPQPKDCKQCQSQGHILLASVANLNQLLFRQQPTLVSSKPQNWKGTYCLCASDVLDTITAIYMIYMISQLATGYNI